VRLVHSISEMDKVQAGDVLVTDMTDPNWEPVMKRAAPSSPTAAGAPATRPSSRASWAFRPWSAAATPPTC
jgi:phosphoenolpyruvate synthase/pyruvate phosphate dikinase